MKSTPIRGVKENLKPCAYNLREPNGMSWVIAYLLHNGAASYPMQHG